MIIRNKDYNYEGVLSSYIVGAHMHWVAVFARRLTVLVEPSGQFKVTDTSLGSNEIAVQHLVLCSKGSESLFLQWVRERIDYINGNSELILIAQSTN